MADAIFRELFVEIPMAIFEQAAREAEERKRASLAVAESRGSRTFRSLFSTETFDVLAMPLARRHGWVRATVSRSAMRDDILVDARLGCGHRHRFEVPEELLYAAEGTHGPGAVAAIIDHLDDHEHERSCFCVAREVSDG